MSGKADIARLLSRVLAGKKRARREKAALTFREKIEIVERMRESVQPIRQAKAAREKSRNGG